jgi:hypothetical protein
MRSKGTSNRLCAQTKGDWWLIAAPLPPRSTFNASHLFVNRETLLFD